MKATLIPILMTFISATSSYWLPSWTLSSSNKVWGQFGKKPHYGRHSGRFFMSPYYRKTYPILPVVYPSTVFEPRYPASLTASFPKPIPIGVPDYQQHQAVLDPSATTILNQILNKKTHTKHKKDPPNQPVVIAHNGIFLLSYPGLDLSQSLKKKKASSNLEFFQDFNP